MSIYEEADYTKQMRAIVDNGEFEMCCDCGPPPPRPDDACWLCINSNLQSDPLEVTWDNATNPSHRIDLMKFYGWYQYQWNYYHTLPTAIPTLGFGAYVDTVLPDLSLTMSKEVGAGTNDKWFFPYRWPVNLNGIGLGRITPVYEVEYYQPDEDKYVYKAFCYTALAEMSCYYSTYQSVDYVYLSPRNFRIELAYTIDYYETQGAWPGFTDAGPDAYYQPLAWKRNPEWYDMVWLMPVTFGQYDNILYTGCNNYPMYWYGGYEVYQNRGFSNLSHATLVLP